MAMPNKAMKITKYLLIAVAVIIVSIIWNTVYYTEVKYSSPVWSPDGKKIYFLKNVDYNKNGIADLDPFFNYYIYKTKSYVMSMNSDGSWKKVLVKYEGVFNRKPYISTLDDLSITPDGKELLFYRSTDPREGASGIYIVNVNVKGLKRLIGEDENYVCYKPFISPDGKKITYTRSYSRQDPNISHPSAWLIDIDGKNDRMICEEKAMRQDGLLMGKQ